MAMNLTHKKGQPRFGGADKRQQGFALLVAVIFMSVMLSLGLALSSLGYKQEILASSAIESQYAFYAADAGLECALYQDQQWNLFNYTSSSTAAAPSFLCDNSPALSATSAHDSSSNWVLTYRYELDSNTHCVDITVYKPPLTTGTTYLFAQGYDVSCSTISNPNGAHFVSRGLEASY